MTLPVEPLVAAWQELRRKAPCAPVAAKAGVLPEAGSGRPAPGWTGGGAEVRDRARRLRSPDRRRTPPTRRSCRSRRIPWRRSSRWSRAIGGSMAAALGTSAVVLFGASRTLEDHAVQACRAALRHALRHRGRQRGRAWAVRLPGCRRGAGADRRRAARSRPSDPRSRPPRGWCICFPPG